MAVIIDMLGMILSTTRDVLPIVIFIFGFQTLIMRRPLPHFRRLLAGLGFVIIGLALFLFGLDTTLFPLGRDMALKLTSPEVLVGDGLHEWTSYLWVYAFALSIGFATTIAEPALRAVAMKAHNVSGGVISIWGLRIAVAIGAATGVALGCFRIITGLPLHYFIMAGYVIVVVQTIRAPRLLIPLAYDSGGVTTSTVTVPMIAGLGLGLATVIPGRSPLLDGFGLIATTALFPIISVLAYSQLSALRAKRHANHRNNHEEASA